MTQRRIVFDVRTTCGSGYVASRLVAYGETEAEVWQDAERRAAQQGADPTTLVAPGINSTRADWEAVFGRVSRQYVFADDDLTTPLPQDDTH